VTPGVERPDAEPDLARDGHPSAVRERVTALLAADPPPAVRARALSALGRAAAFERTEASLAEAAQVLAEAARLQGALGLVGDQVSSLLALGVSVHQAGGRLPEALRTLDAATDLLPGRTRERAAVLTFRADAQRLADRPREAEADAREAFAVGVALDDPRSAGYAAWVLVDLAADDGDATGVRRWTEEMLRYPGDWFAHPSGIEALAAAADAHDRVGARAEARELLAQAWERSREDPRYAEIPLFAEAASMARHGDPAVAADLLAQVMASPELPARERWRVLLLDALAALRRGDPQTAGRRAAAAFDRAEALGTLARVSRVERMAASRLVGLAADAGSPAAARHAGAVAGWVTLLGRFAVQRAGGPLNVPDGQPALLVKLLAVHGGRLHVDAVLDRLWPNADPGVCRRRLRNLLNRLTSAAPGLVVRAGDRLTLGEGIGVDVQRFLDLARSALHAPQGEAPAAQRAALAAYTGPLLPDDRGEEALWEAREQVRRLHLALLDALAGHAEAAGVHDEAAALLTVAFEADPADAPRAHQLAALLAGTGREAAARVTLDRHRRALHDLVR
jgi:DNA-binding SARP family transcriptional activator